MPGWSRSATYLRTTAVRWRSGSAATRVHSSSSGRSASGPAVTRGRRDAAARSATSSAGTARRARPRCASIAHREVIVSSQPRRFAAERSEG